MSESRLESKTIRLNQGESLETRVAPLVKEGWRVETMRSFGGVQEILLTRKRPVLHD